MLIYTWPKVSNIFTQVDYLNIPVNLIVFRLNESSLWKHCFLSFLNCIRYAAFNEILWIFKILLWNNDISCEKQHECKYCKNDYCNHNPESKLSAFIYHFLSPVSLLHPL